MSETKSVGAALRNETPLTRELQRTETGIALIAEERERQINSEGWSSEHDAGHSTGDLARAAARYVTHYHQRAWLLDEGKEQVYQADPPGDEWPWDEDWWKPKGKIRDLVRAGALIAAEIDRLLRLSQK